MTETFKRQGHQVIIQITQDDAGSPAYVCTHQVGARRAFTIPLTPEQYSSTVFYLLTRGYSAVW